MRESDALLSTHAPFYILWMKNPWCEEKKIFSHLKNKKLGVIILLGNINAAEFVSGQIDSPWAVPIVVHLRPPPPAHPRPSQTASGETQSNMSSQRQINSQENSYTPLSPPSPLTFFLLPLRRHYKSRSTTSEDKYKKGKLGYKSIKGGSGKMCVHTEIVRWRRADESKYLRKL